MDPTTLTAVATAVVVGIAIVVVAVRQTEKKARQALHEIPLDQAIDRFAVALEKQLGLPLQGVWDLDEFIVSVPPAKKDDIAFVLGVVGLIPKCAGLTGSWKSSAGADGEVVFVTSLQEMPLSRWVRARIGCESAPTLQSLLSAPSEERA